MKRTLLCGLAVICTAALLSATASAVPQETTDNQIRMVRKQVAGLERIVFEDSAQREVNFRGWNVSGSVKLKSMGYRPFKTVADARESFDLMAAKTGANIIRYTLSWEGVHLGPDEFDMDYLRDTVAFIREAIRNDIYIMLVYPQTLYSRHLWGPDSRHTGNGAPEWIVPREVYPVRHCVVCFNWGMNNLLNPTVKLAYEHFWNNQQLPTVHGELGVQDQFLSQAEYLLSYLRMMLTDEEFDYILGLNPMNEPIHGGFQGLTSHEWYQQKMWPFYQRIRAIMDGNGYEEKFLFAEPLVFWNTNAPFVVNVDPWFPADAFEQKVVFNVHFYDALRMSVSTKAIHNGSYMGHFDKIRQLSQQMGIPAIVSEFGMWVEHGRVKNQARTISAAYQALDSRLGEQQRQMPFVSDSLAGIQWHWDIYYGQHHELINDNPQRVVTTGDAWNDEFFSVISDRGTNYTTPDAYSVERAYPHRIQGDLLHTYYNGIPFDGRDSVLNWATLRSPSGEDFGLENKIWLYAAWQPNNQTSPSEFFLPPHLVNSGFTVVTANTITHYDSSQNPQGTPNNPNISFRTLGTGSAGINMTLGNVNSSNQLEYVLIISSAGTALAPTQLSRLQGEIQQSLQQGIAPVYWKGRFSVDHVPTFRGDRRWPWGIMH